MAAETIALAAQSSAKSQDIAKWSKENPELAKVLMRAHRAREQYANSH